MATGSGNYTTDNVCVKGLYQRPVPPLKTTPALRLSNS